MNSNMLQNTALSEIYDTNNNYQHLRNNLLTLLYERIEIKTD